jgi:ABC-type transport system involved in cytochrome bd biosynthesis fused ATPase/permease subunit
MKFLLIATLLMSSAFADNHEEKGKNLEEIKARISTNINQRIAGLQTHLACVQGAATKEALKACQETHRASMKKLKEENKGERQEWKDKKRAEKEAKKAEKKK